MPLQIEKKSLNENIIVVKLTGQIDESNLEELSNPLDTIKKEYNIIILNIKDLYYINSKVIGYFAALYSDLNKSNKKLVFAEGNPQIMDIISLVGLTNIIEYYETESEAINSNLLK